MLPLQAWWKKVPSPVRLPLHQLGLLLHAIGHYFVVKRGTLMAAALSFATVVSLVPLAAVLFGVTAWVTEPETVRDWVEVGLIEQILPDIELSPQVLGSLSQVSPLEGPPAPGELAGMEDVVESTKQSAQQQLGQLVLDQLTWFQQNGRKLGLIGGVAALVVAVMLFNTIEIAINDIWQVSRRRRIALKLITFTAMIVYVPLFLGLSLWLQQRVLAYSHAVSAVTGLFGPYSGAVLSLLLSVTFFMLFNWVVPYTTVRWYNALAGGAFSGVMFELAKWAFAVYIGSGERMATLYGQLAVAPIFLLWVYYTWVITLLGTHITYGVQVGTTGLQFTSNPLPLRLVTWRVCLHIARCFVQGTPTGGTMRIAADLRLPIHDVDRVIQSLIEAGIIAPAEGRRTTMLPAQPLAQLTLASVLEAVEPLPAAQARQGTHTDPRLFAWERAMREALPAKTLEELAHTPAEETTT